jgi:hypothetical protein
MKKPSLVAAIVVGSIAVHVVAACTASVVGTQSNSSAGDAGLVDAMLDAFLDVSTPDALADPTGSTTTSGSRLRARYTVTTSPDGAASKVFVGWHDTTLDVDCVFLTADDGSLRCVPSGAGAQIVSPSEVDFSTFFSDAACKSAMAVSNISTFFGCAPFLVSIAGGSIGSCTSGSVSYTTYRQTTATLPTTIYTIDSTGACTPQAGPTSGSVALITRVPAAQMQTATVTTVVE